MIQGKFRSGTTPGIRSGEPWTRDEVIRAQEKIRRTPRAEFQLDLQTSQEEQLQEIDTIRGENLSFYEDLCT